MDLLVLGPLELWHDQRQHELGSLKERCVLAVLLHARGEPVTVDTLMDRVWDGEPPPTAVDTLHTYLSRLRRRLRRAVGDDLAQVRRHSSRTYQLRADPGDIDLLRFNRLRSQAVAAAGRDREVAVGLLRAAEAQWHGEPLAEFADNSWAQSTRARLAEDHRRVREERIRLEMELGRHADLLGELQELASQNPFAQRVIGSLMLALYRSGRHDEALTVFRDTRTRLHRSQGIEPTAELQQLHLRMLEQDHDLLRTGAAGTDAPPTARPAPPVPAALPVSAAPAESLNCLPRDIPDFVGRSGELRILLAGAGAGTGTGTGTRAGGGREATGGGAGTALPVTVIHGMPGIGKTALAVHAAHQLAPVYPDAQFYVDLRGHSGQQPLDPSDALAVLLHTAGCDGPLPATLDERATKWREWTARRRALLVLDNVRDAAQVAPLLPGSPACRVLVTTRNRLAGLDGAAPLLLDTLSGQEAESLFTRVAGASRVAADPENLRRIAAACACHPLALQVLASRFRHRGAWDLRHLLDRLRHASRPLQEYDSLISAVFRFSYAELGAPAQELFRLLALHPGPDLALPAATALTGAEDPALLEQCVEELLDASLLEEPVLGRYRLHDLTRSYAAQVGLDTDTERTRTAATGRLAHHYLATAHRADLLIRPHRRAFPLPSPRQTTASVPALSDADEASVWLAVERANLTAVARMAADRHPQYAALFPRVLAGPLKLWGAWGDASRLFEAALPVLRGSGDRALLARTLTDRADLLAQRNHGEALDCATEALAIHEELHDEHGRADALFQSGRARLAAGHGETALPVLEEARALYRTVGDPAGEADCLNVQGAALSYLGRYDQALEKVERMGTIHESLHDLHGLARAQNNRGELHFLQGRYADARACYEESLVLMRRYGGRTDVATVSTNLGAVHQAMGRTDEALTHFRRTLAVHRASGDSLGEADALILAGRAYAESGRRGEALLHFTMAERVAADIDNPYETIRASLGAADVQRESGRLDLASQGYERALEVAERIHYALGSAQALAGLARTTVLSRRTVGLAEAYGERAAARYRALGAETEAAELLRFLAEHRPAGPRRPASGAGTGGVTRSSGRPLGPPGPHPGR
ncbi:AfsR/SARP family transcriptional regulator [Streptomyces olivaceus]|uniref:AfsR/SARP family transcriptional regulator n=1 Tax=Streptomyces olivaceus TaxID=47716 RepID=UPI001CD00440|nr:tetratricopeptide repeat protein [Streptomyces olivaceus]